jgi:hypothetical protein
VFAVLMESESKFCKFSGTNSVSVLTVAANGDPLVYNKVWLIHVYFSLPRGVLVQ